MPATFPQAPRTRIAPTPSGFLHLGNGMSALYTWLLARKLGGRLWLRIDDLDQERQRPEYVADIFDSLRWLGLDWDDGPQQAGEFEAHSQHRRLPRYEALLARLRAGGALYACPCSRRQVREASPSGAYPGTCRHAGHPLDAPDMAWRIAVPEAPVVLPGNWPAPAEASLAEAMGDFVVRQKDGRPAYQIASLADDLDYGTTLLVRGEDLLPSSAAQQYLAQRLGEEGFGQCMVHHPLVCDAGGGKLSKSAGAPSLRALRGRLGHPGAVYEALSYALGQPAAGSLDALLQGFDPQRPLGAAAPLERLLAG
jgi:glutamyl-tRNA synthetase